MYGVRMLRIELVSITNQQTDPPGPFLGIVRSNRINLFVSLNNMLCCTLVIIYVHLSCHRYIHPSSTGLGLSTP